MNTLRLARVIAPASIALAVIACSGTSAPSGAPGAGASDGAAPSSSPGSSGGVFGSLAIPSLPPISLPSSIALPSIALPSGSFALPSGSFAVSSLPSEAKGLEAKLPGTLKRSHAQQGEPVGGKPRQGE